MRRLILKRGLLLAAGLVALIYCITVCMYVAKQPYVGLYVLNSSRVATIARNSPADQAGLHQNDKLHTFAGQPVSDATDLVRLTRDLTVPSQVTVTWSRSGKPGTFSAEMEAVDSPFPVYLLLWTVVSAAILTTAFIMYLRRPEDKPTTLFYLVSVLMVIMFVGALSWYVIAGSAVLVTVFIVASGLLVPTALHFFLIYPENSPALTRWPRLKALVYVPSLVYLLGALLVVAKGFSVVGADRFIPIQKRSFLDVLLGLALWQVLVALAYVAAVAVNLTLVYRRTVQDTVRNQIKWITWGAAVAVVPFILLAVLAVESIDKWIFGEMQFMILLMALAMLVSAGLSLLKYRLMYVDTLLNRSLAYVAVSSLVLALFFGITLIVTVLVSFITGEQSWIALVIAALAITYLFRPMADWVQSFVDRRFYREKYEFQQAVWNVSSVIVSILDLDEVLRKVLDTVIDSLKLKRGAILLRDPASNAATLAYQRDFPEPQDLLLAQDDALLTALRTTRRPVVLRELIQDTTGDEDLVAMRERLQHMYTEVAIPILREDELQGIFILGRKRSRQIFTSEDIRLLETLANQASVAIHNARTYRTIHKLNQDLNEQVRKVEEQRREILALQQQLLSENIYLKEEIGQQYNFQDIVGASSGLREVLDTVKKVALSNSAVLVNGESGTGKELVARAIHFNSPRHDKPFVKVNCAALPESLLESELFGHERGAFTGAVQERKGRFEIADGGTIFLDEIGDIPPALQVKLLRILQEKEFERIGSNRTRRVDVRIVAATNRNLEKMLEKGEFREDLFYRLNVIRIEIPPLRSRREDVFPLAIHFLNKSARQVGKPIRGIDDDAVQMLKSYDWPGNVRELENLVERAVVLAEGPKLTLADFPAEIARSVPTEAVRRGAQESEALPDRMGRMEMESLKEALSEAGGNKSEAARLLGLARSTFLSKLKKWGLE